MRYNTRQRPHASEFPLANDGIECSDARNRSVVTFDTQNVPGGTAEKDYPLRLTWLPSRFGPRGAHVYSL